MPNYELYPLFNTVDGSFLFRPGFPASAQPAYVSLNQIRDYIAGFISPSSEAGKKYVIATGDTTNSLVHSVAADYVLNDVIQVDYYDNNHEAQSGGRLKVINVRSSAFGGTLGTLTNDTATTDGLVIEGLWHRFAIVPVNARIDIRRAGIRCIEGVTGWHSRLVIVLAWAKAAAPLVVLTGAGVLSCTETVVLDRVFWEGENLRFQAGTQSPNGATAGVPTFFATAGQAQTNTAITITPGTPVTIGHTAHGFTANQQILLGRSLHGRLPASLTQLTQTYFVKTVLDANSYTIALTAGGAAINNATAGHGTFYAFYSTTGQSLPSQSNITTQDVMHANGKIERLGILVRAGLNGSNRDWIRQHVTAWGDRNSDNTTWSRTMAIRHEADDSPNAYYKYTTNYSQIGLGLQGPAEKHFVELSGTFNGIHCYMLNTSSVDTLRLRLHSSNAVVYYCENENMGTSIGIDLVCESRDDPSLMANWDWDDDHPAFLVRNGKTTAFSGEIRGQNGKYLFYITGHTNLAGTSMRYGADKVVFKDVSLVHGYGCALAIIACRYVMGSLHINDWNNAYTPGTVNAPVVQIGRVQTASGLHVTMTDIKNFEGVNVGGSTYGLGYYPYGGDLGTYSVSMGNEPMSHSPDAADGTLGVENVGALAFPTTLLASNIEKMKGGSIRFTAHRGNSTIGQFATDTATIEYPREIRRYTITKHASAVVDLGYMTLATAGLTIV